MNIVENLSLVTVITATYNLIDNGRKDWFIQNLESVQNQTYKNIEHIVIDGASTDGTVGLLKEYQQKGWIKYYSEKDNGIYDAMNKGILKANGKYVVCLNSDDCYCDNQAVEWLVSMAEEHNADACYGDARVVDEKTGKLIGIWSGEKTIYPWRTNFPCHQTFIVKTDVMKELGLYNLKYKACADNAFLLSLFQNNKNVCGINKEIILFRKGGFTDFNQEIVKEDKKNLLFEEYGQYHGWTNYDCEQYVQNKFLGLPLEEAIKLGSKLEKSEWLQQYYTILINHHIKNSKQTIIQKEKITANEAFKHILSKAFSVKNELSNNKKRKIITILGIKIKFKCKNWSK